MASVWGELKRRNVVKVAVAYAIVGWLLIEVTLYGRSRGLEFRSFVSVNRMVWEPNPGPRTRAAISTRKCTPHETPAVNGQCRTASGLKDSFYGGFREGRGRYRISPDAPKVPGAGLEPARSYLRGIFLPATAFAAALILTHLGSGLSLCPTAEPSTA